ncbi:bifunctional enoyl-CoA hydratase/phosphate acetyltransferase [uncultured Thioclava sp.]|uniref:bifunctional enoyl-CoA hydratase/phosphate acetyltransferase n=1 Tax=uncultured Thioclava sp. TaxID=473858 RepID=UPI0025E04FEB|nr:bifunctional enoyl-CoA hydratase/phosphate acetyltransferase [uncultured Thioclava sp.]
MLQTDTDLIANRTIAQIKPGDSARLSRKLTVRDLELISALGGGGGPVACETGPIAWAGSSLAALIGTRLPGAGSRIDAVDLRFHAGLAVGDTLDLEVRVRSVDLATRAVVFDCTGTGPKGKSLVEGSLQVTAPANQITRAPSDSPNLIIGERGAKFRKLIAQAKTLKPILTAIVHPVEPNAIAGAIEAAQAGLISPVFVGPEARIRAAAKEAGLDLSNWPIEDTEHSDAAAEMAARMAHEGRVHALMKGSLHTDEFLHPILQPELNLRTKRRLSHVFLMDVPGTDRLLFITDGAINIAPDLAAKTEIVQNAIEMAHALGVETPRVAILSAVEVINPRIPSTLDAAALCKMAERGQITGAVLDGPLAFDNAVSTLAAEIKHIHSDVAGRADILLAPDLDAGNMIAKQLEYLASSEAAGVVLGARVPIVLTSRADSAQSRLASCAVASLIHAHRVGSVA